MKVTVLLFLLALVLACGDEGGGEGTITEGMSPGVVMRIKGTPHSIVNDPNADIFYYLYDDMVLEFFARRVSKIITGTEQKELETDFTQQGAYNPS